MDTSTLGYNLGCYRKHTWLGYFLEHEPALVLIKWVGIPSCGFQIHIFGSGILLPQHMETNYWIIPTRVMMLLSSLDSQYWSTLWIASNSDSLLVCGTSIWAFMMLPGSFPVLALVLFLCHFLYHLCLATNFIVLSLTIWWILCVVFLLIILTSVQVLHFFDVF